MENSLIIPNSGSSSSISDYRDIKTSHFDTLSSPIPAAFEDDFSQIPVTMQNKIGICTSNLCYIVERLLQKRGINVRLSRKFLYNTTKWYIDNNLNEGSSPRSALKAAYAYGIAEESLVPTDTTLEHSVFVQEHDWSKSVLDNAAKYKIKGYIGVDLDNVSLARAMYQYGALYARFEVGKEWYTSKTGEITWDKDKILPLRPPEQIISGHAAIPRAYHFDNSDIVPHLSIDKIRNSWSDKWADKGEGSTWLDSYAPHLTEAWAVSLDPLPVNHSGVPTEENFSHYWSKPLNFGDENNDVKALQIALKLRGFYDYLITGYYGKITSDAVYAYQKYYTVSSLSELLFLKGKRVGPKTLTLLNKQYNK